MSALLPAAVYGLEVPAGDVMVPAGADFPSAFRITMAALDPTAPAEHYANLPEDAPPRATLKLIRVPIDEDESDEEDEDDELDALLDGASSDEESDDEEANGGPSDPAKSKKAKREAAIQALKDALAQEEESDDEEMGGVNGKVNKGKAPASDEDSEDDEDGDNVGLDEYVICTLNPNSHYQQTLDITVGENETVFFKVTGTHAIYLTGNYVMPVDDSPHSHMGMDEDEDELDYDDEDGLDYLDEDEESDDLDDIEDPRVTEVESEEDAPKLIAAKGKGKKRAAEEETLDEIMAKAETTNGLSKKQLKKLKNNAGEAASAPVKDDKKSDKKVQFAEKLEQGPTGSTAADKKSKKDKKPEEKKADAKPATGGVRTVQGVKVDDRSVGKGPAAKKGNTVGMRYIGKLEDGKVFDCKFPSSICS